jgi:hypothetical protein
MVGRSKRDTRGKRLVAAIDGRGGAERIGIDIVVNGSLLIENKVRKDHVGRAPSPVQAQPAARRVVVSTRLDLFSTTTLQGFPHIGQLGQAGRLSYGKNHIQPLFGQALARTRIRQSQCGCRYSGGSGASVLQASHSGCGCNQPVMQATRTTPPQPFPELPLRLNGSTYIVNAI